MENAHPIVRALSRHKNGVTEKFICKYADGINAIIKMKENISDNERYLISIFIIEYCEMAINYNFHEEGERKLDVKIIRAKTPIANSAKRLAQFCRLHPLAVSGALMSAILDSGVHLRTKSDNAPIEKGVALSRSHADRLGALLEAFATSIENGGLLAQQGPFLHRHRVGPLYFPRGIEGQKSIPEPETCLGVFLSFQIRNFLERRTLRWFTGETMPPNQPPHWPVVSAFVSNAFAKQLDVKPRCEKLLARHPDLEMWGYS